MPGIGLAYGALRCPVLSWRMAVPDYHAASCPTDQPACGVPDCGYAPTPDKLLILIPAGPYTSILGYFPTSFLPSAALAATELGPSA
eukprot:3402614-Rhodomonas_salina.1